MDFSAVALTEAQQAFAREVQEFLDEHLTEEVYARARETGNLYDRGVQLAMGARGWAMPRWKKEEGGAELDDVCVKILETGLAERNAPVAVFVEAAGRIVTLTAVCRRLTTEVVPFAPPGVT